MSHTASSPGAPARPTAEIAAERDELLQAALDFIKTLTGMEPPPIEVAPPEVFAPFRAFVDRVQAITGRHDAFSECQGKGYAELPPRYYLMGNESVWSADQMRAFADATCALRSNNDHQGEPLVRYCPGCGSVGPVEGNFLDCCPDGHEARMIPQPLAQKCHDIFGLALAAALAEKGSTP